MSRKNIFYLRGLTGKAAKLKEKQREILEEIGEEMSAEAEGPAPRRKGGGFWVVLTVIFVVATAVLAWLYTVQLDELAALQVRADQATSRAVRLQQANRQVSTELAGLVEKLREVVKVVEVMLRRSNVEL